MWRTGTKRILPLALLVAAALAMRDEMFRPLWFDEALTMTEFVPRPSAADIYFSYAIPNNHIVFTALERGWVELAFLFGLALPDFALRILPAILALLALFAVYFSGKGPSGRWAGFLTALFFAASLPFAIYSTALRGYMAGLLFVFLGCAACRRLMLGGRRPVLDGALWFAASFLACGTIPSNIFALEAGALLFAPLAGWRRVFSWRGACAFLAPPAALLVFYGPILGKLLNAAALKEGWTSRLDSLSAFYVSTLVSFLPLLAVFAACVAKEWGRRKVRLLAAGTVLALLLPAVAEPLLGTPPFPRVFFPLWAVLMTSLVCGTRFFLTGAGRTRAARAVVVLAVAAAGWGLLQRACAERLSESLTPPETLDDYFKPYYMRRDFTPLATLRAIEKELESSAPVYVTFKADPYSIRYYWRYYGKLDEDLLLFDNPKRRVYRISENSLIVARDKADLDEAMRKYDLKEVSPVSTDGFQKTYRTGPRSGR